MRRFGTATRESHDSSAFYARALFDKAPSPAEVDFSENTVPEAVLDQVFCRDSRTLPMLPDRSVHLVVTSPPYNVGKEYDEDLSLGNYRSLLRDVFLECRRVLVPGGRVCINVANLGRKPYVPLHKYIIDEMESLGFLMRGEIIWDKSASAGTSTAWGSWRSAANPTLRDVHEYVLVFSKDTYKRERAGRPNTITDEEFLKSTKSLWSFPAESARKVKHPAPFPVELPYRLIQLYTFKGEIVLDPFAGSGSTGVAAMKAERRFVLCDSSAEYVGVACDRIASARKPQTRRRKPA
jgi:site-specific DNA-methyltransferase (adenine-specific)